MFVNVESATKHITVELSFFCFCVTNEIIKFLSANLYIQKACRFNQTSEPDLDTPCDDEERGILFLSEISSKYYPISYCACHILTIFATCWSDSAGRRRRPLIFLPLTIQFLSALSGCLHSYFWSLNPMLSVFTEILFDSMSGGMALITYASQMYLCDNSSKETRTMRLGVLGAIKVFTILIGKGSSGFILRCFGFLFSYFMCYLLSTLGIILGLLFINDTSIPVQNEKKIHQIISIFTVTNSFQVVFKKSLGHKRIVILLLLLTNAAAYFPTCGEFAVLYLYLRHRFQWDERKYSSFMLYKFTMSTCGMLFGSIILSKRLKTHDGMIGVFAGFWDTLAAIGLLLASQNWHIYLIPILDIFHGTALTVCTSFMSKYYHNDELGRLGAVINVIGLVSPFSYPLYNIVFQKTLNTFPSAFCIVSIAMDITVVGLYATSYYLSKKFESEESKNVDKKLAIAPT